MNADDATGFFDEPAPTGAPKRSAWKFAPGGRAASVSSTVVTSPIVLGGRVYAGAHDGLLRAFDAATGSVHWSAVLGHRAPDPLVLGSQVFATTGAQLVALDAGTGAEQWRTGVLDASSPVALRDEASALVIVRARGQVRAFDPRDGRERWHYTVGDSVGPLSVTDEGLVLGSRLVFEGLGSAFALDARTGAQRWSVSTNTAGRAATPTHKGLGYRVTGTGRELVCVDLATGARAWSHTTATGLFTTPAVDARCVYTVGGSSTFMSNTITARDHTAGGATLWQVTVECHAVCTELVVARGTLLCVLGRTLVALDASTGEERWRREGPDELLDRPALGAGMLFVPTRKALIAYRA